jgi:integrase
LAKRVPPLTAAQVTKLKPDPEKTLELVDGAVPGLRLRITPAGTRTWSLNVRANGVMRRFEVGRQLGLAEARTQAAAMRQRIGNGADPTAEKRAARQRAVSATQGVGTLRSVVATYFSSGRGSNLRSKAEQEKRIKSVFVEHLDRPAIEVTSAELQLAIDGHKAKTSAARATSYLVKVLKWAAKRGLVHGPFNLEKPEPPPPNQRVLSQEELAMVLPAFNGPYGACSLFILLTGARLQEATNATWGEFDLTAKVWTVSAGRRKDTRPPSARSNRKKDPLVVPLPRQIVKLLKRVREAEKSRRQMVGDTRPIRGTDLVFAGQRGGKLNNWHRWLNATAKKTGVTGWSAHALRRTTATLAGELRVPPHVVSIVLGHVNVGGQLVSGYNQSRYASQHADALQKVADLVSTLMRSGKVQNEHRG